VELTVIIAGLLLAIGGLAALAELIRCASAADGTDPARRPADPPTGGLPARRGPVVGSGAGPGRRARTRIQMSPGRVLALSLAVGLGVIAVASVSLGKLVEDVTHGDGLALIDHPVARFVAAHRTPALTSAMGAVSAVAAPAAMAGIALAAGVLLAIARRSWAPVLELGVTVVGIVGLTVVFKATLGLPRPPAALAAAAADGYGFPSGHAATAAAVCGVAAWLATTRLRSRPARAGIWAVAAMLTVAVGISRVYLGVHWAPDVIGGWIFGILWMAIVVGAWAAFGRLHASTNARATRDG